LIWTPGKLVYIYKNSLNNRGIKHKSLRRLYARNIDGFRENRRNSFKRRNIQETKGKMNIEYDKSFVRSLEKIQDKNTLLRIQNAILKSEKSLTLESIPGSKKLIGFSKYYRIKMGDYRLGFERINSLTIRFIIVEHRKDIYKKFP
jgi:mRNA interferase RelE/StbE